MNWKAKDVTFYINIINEINDLCREGGSVSHNKIYDLLPTNFYDLKIVLDGEDSNYRYAESRAIDGGSFEKLPDLQCGLHEFINEIPVEKIFNKTKTIILENNFIDLYINNKIYMENISELFDQSAIPNLIGWNEETTDYVKNRRKEFYKLINSEDVTFIEAYIAIVLSPGDGFGRIDYGFGRSDSEVVINEPLYKYTNEPFDNWQKAWNNVQPLMCFKDGLPEGLEPAGCPKR